MGSGSVSSRGRQLRRVRLVRPGPAIGAEPAKPVEVLGVRPQHPAAAGAGQLPAADPAAADPAVDRRLGHPQLAAQVAEPPLAVPARVVVGHRLGARTRSGPAARAVAGPSRRCTSRAASAGGIPPGSAPRRSPRTSCRRRAARPPGPSAPGSRAAARRDAPGGGPRDGSTNPPAQWIATSTHSVSPCTATDHPLDQVPHDLLAVRRRGRRRPPQRGDVLGQRLDHINLIDGQLGGTARGGTGRTRPRPDAARAAPAPTAAPAPAPTSRFSGSARLVLPGRPLRLVAGPLQPLLATAGPAGPAPAARRPTARRLSSSAAGSRASSTCRPTSSSSGPAGQALADAARRSPARRAGRL